MKNSRYIRSEHVGKTPYEKNAYKRFLLKSSGLETTEKKFNTVDTTDSSNFEEEKKPQKSRKTKKPFRLRLRDAFGFENLLSNIFVSLIVAAIAALVWMGYLVYSHGDKIEVLEVKQKETTTILSGMSDKVNDIGNNINILKDKIPFLLEVFRSKVQ